LLGFFVQIVIVRWLAFFLIEFLFIQALIFRWEQFTRIPTPQRTAVVVSSLVYGTDVSKVKFLRSTILRYVCLSIAMALRKLSTRALEKYPKEEDFIKHGLLNEDELTILLDSKKLIEHGSFSISMHMLPIKWAMKLAEKARSLNLISNDNAFKVILGLKFLFI
jgi:hypothetical protein